MRILTSFALLIPAFSLLYTPRTLSLPFLRVHNAPLPKALLNAACSLLSENNLTRGSAAREIHRLPPTDSVQQSLAQASVCILAPLNFPRKDARPVSYYALFK